MPNWVWSAVATLFLVSLALAIMHRSQIFLRLRQARKEQIRDTVVVSQQKECLPSWVAMAASDRSPLAVCPLCDDFCHQIMTAWVCWDIAYVLDECRIVECSCCGKEGLGFYYIPQEQPSAPSYAAWGANQPDAQESASFLSYKLNLWREAIHKYRIEQAHQQAEEKIIEYAALGWGDYGMRHLE